MSKVGKSTFSIQAFREKGRGLEAEPSQQVDDEAQALRKVERMAVGKAGAVAIRQDGDAALGDCQEPVVLKVVGRVPPIFMDLPF